MKLQGTVLTQRVERAGTALFLEPCLVAGALLVVASCSAAYGGTCESLKELKLPHVSISAVESIAAGSYQPPGSPKAFADLPAFCRVTATVTPVSDSSIGIEVWLPTTTWNGRYQQVGNHGWGGTIYWSEMVPQLQRGFATGATDDGHGAPGPTIQPDGSRRQGGYGVDWGFNHPTKIVDVASRSVHELAQNAKLLIAAYYGKPQRKAYFNGCSNGGREGLREAHDFPKDFDGILAGGAASFLTHSATEQLFVTRNLRSSGIQGPAGAAILALAQNAAIKECGEVLNGVADGLIIDPRRCHWNPHTLICKAGQDAKTCITPAQADAIEANVEPLVDPVTHELVMTGMSRGSEHDQIRFGFNDRLAPFAVATYELALNNPSWDGNSFDLHADLMALDQVIGVMNTTDTDLRPFKAAGGKLIQWHGWSDVAFPPGATAKNYEDVIRDVGHGDAKSIQSFYRLFMLPNVGHCGTGVGPDDIGAENQIPVSADPEHDAVSALLEWVENGRAPDMLLATKFNVANDPQSGIKMQRPICPYPKEAIWNGSGDINDARSFHCGIYPSNGRSTD